MNKDYLEHIAQDRRLAMLRLLTESRGSANESVLHVGLEALGHRHQPRSQIRDDIRYLEKLDLLKVDIVSGVMVCDITRRGVDVAEGRAEAEGVKKPSIGV